MFKTRQNHASEPIRAYFFSNHIWKCQKRKFRPAILSQKYNSGNFLNQKSKQKKISENKCKKQQIVKDKPAIEVICIWLLYLNCEQKYGLYTFSSRKWNNATISIFIWSSKCKGQKVKCPGTLSGYQILGRNFSKTSVS